MIRKKNTHKSYAFYKATIVLPLLLIYLLHFMHPSLSVPELHLYIEPYEAELLFLSLTVLWLCISPFRKDCCNGTWSEMMFNLVPIEVFMLFNLAQWNFIVFMFVNLLLVLALVALFIWLRDDENKHRRTKDSHQWYKSTYRKCAILLMGLILLPSLPFFIAHGASKTYISDQLIQNLLFGNGEEDAEEKEINPYEKNQELWNCFQEEKWTSFSVPEKIIIIQQLADFEAKSLGINSVTVKADLIGSLSLGSYRTADNSIVISTSHLDGSDLEEVINTICHEIRHSFQYQIVEAIDWSNALYQISYFDELRAWRDNHYDYKNAWMDGYNAYENQVLEVDAREYAKNETAKILSYVKEGE